MAILASKEAKMANSGSLSPELASKRPLRGLLEGSSSWLPLDLKVHGARRVAKGLKSPFPGASTLGNAAYAAAFPRAPRDRARGLVQIQALWAWIWTIKPLLDGFSVVSQLGNWETTENPWCWEATLKGLGARPRASGSFQACSRPESSRLAPLLAVLILHFVPDQLFRGPPPRKSTRVFGHFLREMPKSPALRLKPVRTLADGFARLTFRSINPS